MPPTVTQDLDRSKPRHPIRVVARRTGLKASLIRAWELRHSAVEPQRSPGNQRLFSESDIERLLLLRRATEAGLPIGQLASLSDQALRRLAAEHAVPPPAAAGAAAPSSAALPAATADGAGAHLAACETAVEALDSQALALALERAAVDLGIAASIETVVAPLMRRVGRRWAGGSLRPMHEHLATAAVETFLGGQARRQQSGPRAPAMIVTTPAGQRHSLGALATAAVAAGDGWQVTYLGGDLPAEEIAAAARQRSASAVVLSVVHPADDVLLGDEIVRLRHHVGGGVALLVGGAAARAYSGALDAAGAELVPDLRELRQRLAEVRRRPAATAAEAEPAPALVLAQGAVERWQLTPPAGDGTGADLDWARRGALLLRQSAAAGEPAAGARAGQIAALVVLQRFVRRLLDRYRSERDPELLAAAARRLEERFGSASVRAAARRFDELFYPGGAGHAAGSRLTAALEGMLLLWVLNQNPALRPLRPLLDDDELDRATGYRRLASALADFLAERPALGASGSGTGAASLFDQLVAPNRDAPSSLVEQLRLLLESPLAHELEAAVETALDVLREEERPAFVPGPRPLSPEVELPALPDGEEEVAARFSPEQPWMAGLVLVTKVAQVWLDQLSRAHGAPVERLDQVPDAELDRLAELGFNGLWLVGLWQRSRASAEIKRRAGNPAAAASAYSVVRYEVAESLGGEAALADLERRAAERGIRLGCDLVPNHMAIDSEWLIEHPERFLSLPAPPFPGYRFTGPDLSSDPRVGIYLEDGYRDRSDAAVVFRRVERSDGAERYVYHGNDGTGLPWNDTAQLDYLNPETREAMLELMVDIAKRFPIVRLDAAMALAKRHIHRLWHPPRGEGGAIPSRSQHSLSRAELDRRMPEELWHQAVERITAAAPGTLLIAEAFWLMEVYFARGLGLHRVYNSAPMHCLREEDNARFRRLLADLLARDPRVLGRFVNYLTNPDEAPAVTQFGKGDKYFALCGLVATLPGLPLFGHGQVEGLTEKYGMDYDRALYTEAPDGEMVRRHRRQIAPLLARRELFAGSEGFRLFDVETADGIAEDVIAFTNRRAGRAALVLVNNRAASSRGVLRRCCPYREPAGGDLRRDTLPQALGLQPGERCRLIDASDPADGQPAAGFGDHGLGIELAPYELRVLLTAGPAGRRTAAIVEASHPEP